MGATELYDDIGTGYSWHEEHRDLLALDEWDAGFRLILSHT